ncbi:Nitrogen fixation regulation protein FixK [Thalassovita gelatinovora]|uniref:Nitrogen fixation regulation protein FixK n=1 Tax=Thalassovita gelatinovora TaxID=53501 RepID=A0A0P1G012_THAGE|nr:Crp/Fnr family transcriptional regulator [Thalassovita gelatinovora]QIZ80072.1 Crp/Fnr family transcriptional regulator [Thalassovita gelatinovora]CUH65488.1 Nitrogen fixation regulation protein FixK [Thalassovita gelatinovora]SER08836.1 Crp-like helix-turn-helix domain-containing protein [Thalassovita gelatinovora]
MNAMTLPWQIPGHAVPMHISTKRHKLFRGLTARQKSTVLRAFTQDIYGDGDPISRDHTNVPHPEIVLRGVLRKEVCDPDGVSRLFGLTFAGEMLSPVGPRTAGVRRTAMGETVLLSCDSDVFAVILEEIPRLRMNYLEELQDQLCEARRWQVMLGRKTAMQRVATLLLSFWERQERPEEMDLRLNRAELGQILCLTFETVSRQIKALEKAGVVALPQPSCAVIRDPQSLFAATGEAVSLRHAA